MPAELASKRAWLVWKFVPNGDKKPRKVPYYASGLPRSGTQGSPEDRAAMVTFDEAVRVARDGGWQGVGFAMHADFNLVALDFDNCVVDRVIDPRVAELVSGTYTEISPSGTGLRAFMRGSVESKKDVDAERGSFAVEYFGHNGFVTVTGDITDECALFGFEDTLCDLTPAVIADYVSRWGSLSRAPSQVFDDDGFGLMALSPTLGLSNGEIVGHLDVLPADLDYDTWVKVGMAVHQETQGEGFELWHNWSKASPKYTTEAYCMERWRSFGKFAGASITMAWLIKQANEQRTRAGYRARDEWKAKLTACSDDFVLREKMCPELARDDRIGEMEREELAQLLVKVFGGLGTKFPIAMCRKLVAPRREERQDFPRNKLGVVEPTLPNVLSALRQSDICGFRPSLDTFRQVVDLDDGAQLRQLTDNDYTSAREHLQLSHSFGEVSKEKMRDAILLVAQENERDSAQKWLSSLPTWDGTPRVDRFLGQCFGTADTPYAQAVSRYIWSALAGRVIQPGVKADMVPVAVGIQGLMKSSAIRAMAPHEDTFYELDLADRDDDTARMLSGKLVVELPELRGMSQRDASDLKAFITKQVDMWVPKYVEHQTRNPRRFIFFGSTNKRDFLTDPTGSRRFLPFEAGRCDPDGVARDRDQLWAEGAALFDAHGVMWEDAERLAEAEHHKYQDDDAWVPAIADYLDGRRPHDPHFPNPLARTTTRDVLHVALDKRVGDFKRADEMRAAACLTSMGWQRVREMANGVRCWFFIRPAQMTA
ncbi:hypothetical protein GmRootV213_18340 [Variovorax sp. V213]